MAAVVTRALRRAVVRVVAPSRWSAATVAFSRSSPQCWVPTLPVWQAQYAAHLSTAASDEEEEDVDIDEITLQMESYVDIFMSEIARIRGGEARADMLDHVKADVYSSSTPLTDIAQIALQGTTLVIRPFDPSTVAAIEKAIADADLGLNPSSDGKVVRAKVPKASAEVRDRSIKQLAEAAETTKKNIRRVRQQAVTSIKALDTVSSDDIFRMQQEVQEATKQASDRVTEIQNTKRAAISG